MENTIGDMLVNLTQLPEVPQLPLNVCIKRAVIVDRDRILKFVRESFPGNSWPAEVEKALFQNPGTCFIAIAEKEVVGFACYDATGLDYFGPTGVRNDFRGRGIGAALLIRTMHAMLEAGYTYAVIGAVGGAAEFYRKILGAEYIKGADTKHSIYANMIKMN